MLERIPKNNKQFENKSLLSHKQPKVEKQNRDSLLPNQNILKAKRQRCKLPEVQPNPNNRRNQPSDKSNINSVNLNPAVQLTDIKPSNVSKQYRCSLLPINFNAVVNPIIEDQNIKKSNQKYKQKSSMHSTIKSFSVQIEDLEVGQVGNGKKKSPQIKKQQERGKKNLFNTKVKGSSRKESQNFMNIKIGNMENETKNKKVGIGKKNNNSKISFKQKSINQGKNSQQSGNQQLSDTEIIINYRIIKSRQSIEEDIQQEDEKEKQQNLLVNKEIVNFYENQCDDGLLEDQVENKSFKVIIKLVSEKQIQEKEKDQKQDARTKNSYSVAYQKPQYSKNKELSQKSRQDSLLKKYKKQNCIHIHRNISALISPKMMTKSIESFNIRKSENELKQSNGQCERKQKEEQEKEKEEEKNISNQTQDNEDEECFLSSKIKSTKSIVNELNQKEIQGVKNTNAAMNQRHHQTQYKEIQAKKENRQRVQKVIKSKQSILKLSKNNSQGSALYSLNLGNSNYSKPPLKDINIDAKGRLRQEKLPNLEFKIHECLQSAKQQLKTYCYK